MARVIVGSAAEPPRAGGGAGQVAAVEIQGPERIGMSQTRAHAVRISGATGDNAADINGVYQPVAGEACGGRPVYKKEGGDVWIEYWSELCQWQVKAGTSRGQNRCLMHSVRAETQAGAVEEVAGGWKVWLSTKAFQAQEGVRVVRKADAVLF